MEAMMTNAMTTMPRRNPIATAFDLAGRFPVAVVELMMRAGVAAVFFKSGLTKIASWDATLALFENEYAVPLLPADIAAYVAAAVELSAPVVLLFGLAARFGAAALLGMTFVIQVFVYPENWAEHLLWASILTYVVTRGAGALSLDAGVARWFRMG
jgi:putative oxidoreductase